MVIEPAVTTDGYDDEVLDYANGTMRDVPAYVQPAVGTETETGDRKAVTWHWTVYTTDPDITARARVEWRGDVHNIQGPPRVWDVPGGFHHTELRLVRTSG